MEDLRVSKFCFKRQKRKYAIVHDMKIDCNNVHSKVYEIVHYRFGTTIESATVGATIIHYDLCLWVQCTNKLSVAKIY